MNEIARTQSALLRDHHRQHRVRSDVERYAQKRIGAPLVKLTRKAPSGHVKLKQHMAGRQRHIVHLGHVPRRYQHPPRIGAVFDLVDHLPDLVDAPSVGTGPTAPLIPVHMVQIAQAVTFDRQRLFPPHGIEKGFPLQRQNPVTDTKFVVIAVSVVVPDMDPVIQQVFYIGIALQKPEQFVNHPFQENFLGGKQRKPSLQVETHLVAEDAARTGSGTVALHNAVLSDLTEQIEILLHGRINIFSTRRCPRSR